MVTKLITAYIGDRSSKCLPMSFDSILPYVDKLIFVWGMDDLKTKDIIIEYQDKYPDKIELIESEYDQEDLGMNGKQRNVYLDYLKKNHLDDWCLVLDPDEVVQFPEKLANFIRTHDKSLKKVKFDNIIFDPQMRHFIGDLGHEDALKKTHYALGRLFKITNDIYYDQVEHPVLQCNKDCARRETSIIVIWHLAYVEAMFKIKWRYENHVQKSNIHTKAFLRDWQMAHLLGTYPKSDIDPLDIPKIIKDYFNFPSDDYFYFANRRSLEIKHFLMVRNWNDYFKPKTVLDCGCGAGQFSYVWSGFCDVRGFDISKYIIENTPFKNLKLFVGSITDFNNVEEYDLVTAVDVLEHLTYEDLDKALENLFKWTKDAILFSIPFEGDPNLELDKTHLIKESKEWWIEKIGKAGFIIEPTPKDWLFLNQILVGRKK